MYCSKCGKEVSDGVAFCPHCGQKTGTEPPEKMGMRVGKAVGTAADRFNEVTGGTGHVELKFKDFFVDVPKRHSKREIEELFICGTSSTTPAIEDVPSEWPRPWVWSRVFMVLLVTTMCLIALLELFKNEIGLPSIMFVGSMTVPVALLVFFFETNAPRNISIVEVIVLFFVGGVASMLAIYLGQNFGLLEASGTGGPVPSILTGLIEELAKISVVAFVMSKRKGNELVLKGDRNYILNGLLIGAAVGAGFAMFETAGYAMYAFAGLLDGFPAGEYSNIYRILVARGLLAVGMHTVWTAVEGAALAMCEKDDGYSTSQLRDPRFVVAAAICVACHSLWNMYLPVLDDISPFLKWLVLVVAIWVIVVVMLNRGLAQINRIANGESAVEPESEQLNTLFREEAELESASNPSRCGEPVDE